MESELEKQQDCVVLRLKGDVRLWGRPEVEKDLLEKFRGALDDSSKAVVLNLSRVNYLDTMGIAALVRVLIECSKRKLALKVVMPAGVPGESLRRVRIFEPWPAFHDEAAALRAGQA